MTTYYLYHHHPDPLPLEDVSDHVWLINNTAAYSVVAVIDAPDVHLALHAAVCKARNQTLPRKTAVRAGNLLRETFPGDVLVTSTDAWMVDEGTTSHLRKVSYECCPTLRSFGQHSTVNGLAWSPDGSLVASCEKEDPAVHLWNAQTGDRVMRLPLSIYTTNEPTIHALAWSPDGTLLAAGCDDRTIQLIDPAHYQHVQTYWTTRAYQGQTVYALAWSPNGALLASGGSAASVDVWQVRPVAPERSEEPLVPADPILAGS